MTQSPTHEQEPTALATAIKSYRDAVYYEALAYTKVRGSNTPGHASKSWRAYNQKCVEETAALDRLYSELSLTKETAS